MEPRKNEGKEVFGANTMILSEINLQNTSYQKRWKMGFYTTISKKPIT